MERLRRLLNALLDVSPSDAEDTLSRRTLAALLVVFALVDVLALALLGVLAPIGLAGTTADVSGLLLNGGAALAGFAVLFLINRRRRGRFVSLVFLLLLVILVVAADTPIEVVAGRSLIFFALPILGASVLLGPGYSLAFAALCSALILVMGLAIEPPNLNILGVVAFMLLAGLSWLWSSRWLRAERERQSAHAALDESESRYRGLFENSLSGIALHRILLDDAGQPSDYVFLQVNAAFEALVGFTAAQVIGRRASELYPDLDPLFLERYGRVALAGEATEFDQYVPQSGRHYHIVAFAPRPGQFATIFEDVTERMTAEAALRASEERYRTLVEHQAEGLCTVDLEERFVFANPAAHVIFGVPRGDMVGRSVADFVPPESWARIQEHNALRTAGQSSTYEYQVIRPDGEVRDVLVTGSPQFDDAGRLVATVGVYRDITERKQAERRVERLLAQQVIVNQLALELGETLEMERIYRTVYGHIQGLMPVTTFIVSRYEPETEMIHAAYATVEGQSLDVATLPPIPLEPPGQGVQSRVIRQGAPLRTDDVQALLAQTSTQYQVTETGEVLEGPAPDERQHEAPHSALYVPMKVEGRVMGVMQVQSEGRDAYTQEDEDLLAAIANVAAVAVQNARLYLAVQSELAERQHAEALLDEQAQQLQQVMDTVPEGVLLVDVHGNLLLSNPLGRELVARLAPETGPRGISELAGRPIQELLEAPALGAWHTLVAAGRTYQAAARPLAVADGSLRWVLVLRDTTDQEELERRLRQQDRMAIIGQLAGGVAHDFNNLLTTILGYTELVLEELPEGSPQRADLGEVRHAAERAAGLTNQLLAFSRQQVVQPRVVSLNQVIGDMLKMLQRLIGEQVSLRVRLAPDLSETLVDPGQLEQVILNLAVNARDAMPQGGTLTLQTLNTTLDEVYTRQYPDVTPGRYVRLDVSDTGTGIAPEVLAHMFEPFFTTKGVGKGTGLGLATVMGIIKQAGGHVTVYSEVGVGSTFKVYLPVCIESETTDDEAKPARPMRSIGGEVVLLVEDEEGVRRLARRTLEEWGYTVLEAATPAEALRLGAEYPGDIHLLLTDVIMPEMSGPAVAEVLRRAFPALPVLYISGYTDDAIAHHGVLEPGVAFLGKPFTAAELTARVRAALDGRTPA